MSVLTYEELVRMPADEQLKVVNEGVTRCGSKAKFCEELGKPVNTLNKHMNELGYHSPKQNKGLFSRDSGKDSKVIVSCSGNSISENNNGNKNNVINGIGSVNDVNSNVSKSNSNVNDVNHSSGNISDIESGKEGVRGYDWANLDSKSLLRAKKEAFSIVLDSLEHVNLDDKAFTSLSMYKDVSVQLDAFAKTFKMNKQDVVSAALVRFLEDFKNKIDNNK